MKRYKVYFIFLILLLVCGCDSVSNQKTDTESLKIGSHREVPGYVMFDNQLYRVINQLVTEHVKLLGETTDHYQVYSLGESKDNESVSINFDGMYLKAIKASFTENEVWTHVFSQNNMEKFYKLNYEEYKDFFSKYSPQITVSIPKGSNHTVTFQTKIEKIRTYDFNVIVTEIWDTSKHEWNFLVTPNEDKLLKDTGESPPFTSK